jgi:hypothetical protein
MSSSGGVISSGTAAGHQPGPRETRGKRTAVFTLQQHEQVHRPDLGQLVVGAEEPEDLLVALLAGLDLRDEAGGVVGAELVAACPAGVGADVLGRC